MTRTVSDSDKKRRIKSLHFRIIPRRHQDTKTKENKGISSCLCAFVVDAKLRPLVMQSWYYSAKTWVFAALLLLGIGANGWGHFGAIIPSTDIVTDAGSRNLHLSAMFFHPFEGEYMNMVKPVQFGVVVQGEKHELLSTLKEKKIGDFSTWEAEYRIERPGDHVFYIEPAPYFEPAEGSFIVHYTKVIVNAMGLEVGWDTEVGLKTEIVPLTRPYGLWTGNPFQGVVKVNGQNAPNTPVEVTYFNSDNLHPPADAFTTQVAKTDANGVFIWTMPRAGWWGFAALTTDEKKLKHTDGVEYDVELGAVLWVKVVDMK